MFYNKISMLYFYNNREKIKLMEQTESEQKQQQDESNTIDLTQLTVSDYQIYRLWLEIQPNKNLQPNDCPFLSTSVNVEEDMSKHAEWLYNHILSKPLINGQYQSERKMHGILHTTRVSIYIPVLANLFKKHASTNADVMSAVSELTTENIKLLQIAALFRESASQNDSDDAEVEQSGIFLYSYFTKVLKVEPEKAKMFSEAVVNKDNIEAHNLNKKNYKSLIQNEKGELVWQETPHHSKKIYFKFSSMTQKSLISIALSIILTLKLSIFIK